MKNFVNEAAYLRKYTSHTEQFLKMHDGCIHSPKHASTVGLERHRLLVSISGEA